MAEYVGTGPYYPDTNTAGVGTNNKAVKNAAPSANTATKQTSQNPATWQLFQPGSTSSGVTGGTGGSPSAPGSDKGWDFLVADFDATSAAPNGLPATRVLAGGTYTIAFTVSWTGINTANIFSAVFFKRTAAGAFTQLGSGVSASVSSATTSISFTADLPRTEFLAGETLYVEYWVKSNDVVPGVTHQTCTFNTGSANNFNTRLAYNYQRSYIGGETPSGTIQKKVIKSLAAGSTPTGAIVNRPNKFFTGSQASSGIVLNRPNKFFTGSQASSGIVLNRPNKFFTGSIGSSGIIVRRVNKSLTATIATSGVLRKSVSRSFAGVVTSSGQVYKTYVKNFFGFLYGPSGSGGGPITIIKRKIIPMGD